MPPKSQPAYESVAWFDPGPDGPRFTLVHRPRHTAPCGTVLLAPPFAEELNKCRRMLALAARSFASDGWQVVQVDLYGCGDSPGDFGDASWTGWLVDLRRALHRHHRSGPLWLWGVRAGALLIPPLLDEVPTANVVLWQPAHDGAVVLNQFLRLRTAASLSDPKDGAVRARLRERLAAGDTLEIAGYRLAPAVANPLAASRLEFPQAFAGRVALFEVDDAPTPALSDASERLLAALREQGRGVSAAAVAGPKFWLTVEASEAPALIASSRAAVSPRTGAHAPVVMEAAQATADRRDWTETPVWIDCQSERMLGIVSRPHIGSQAQFAVLIVVGGPQYRVGSHRQFVALARALARAGIPSLRFDYRGMGDSEGEPRNFETIEADLRAAIATLCTHTGVPSIAIWGLCDAASAALLFGAADTRVRRLILVNPWVRSETSLATTHLKHYYWQRMRERDFWRKLAAARVDWRATMRELLQKIRLAAFRPAPEARPRYQSAMARAWRQFPGQILLVLSGRDLTAKEFLEYVGHDPEWAGLIDEVKVSRVDLAEADHTFSSAAWKRWLEEQTVRFLTATFEPDTVGPSPLPPWQAAPTSAAGHIR